MKMQKKELREILRIRAYFSMVNFSRTLAEKRKEGDKKTQFGR